MKRILTEDEIAFLLKGGAGQPVQEESRGVRLIETLAGLFPRKRVVLALALLCISVIPLLGGHLFRRAYGEELYLGMWVLTAVAGSWLIMRDAGPGLEGLLCAVRAGQSPERAALQRLVRALAGLMLIMPGPVVNVLACLLLLPPLSRTGAIFLRRKLDGYLSRT